MIENIITLALLIILQAVLGFDNLLYISLESKRAPLEKQASVRRYGILIAIGLRIGLLFLLINLIGFFQEPVLTFDNEFIHGSFNVHSFIVLTGGVFIVYTAMKEIMHMMTLEKDDEIKNDTSSSAKSVITMIVVMNIVFSFDSILSAMALTEVFWVMATAIVISGLLMLYLADHVSEFLKKNRMYEVLGLFILFVVGIMLLTEGGHMAHLHLLGNEITAMSKTTFYFILSVLIFVDIVQSRYQKKLAKE